VKFYFVGNSFAANHLRAAAEKRGLALAETVAEADFVFISEDTETDSEGNRNLEPIRQLVDGIKAQNKPFVVTSQVTPGWCWANGVRFHQAETLRIIDAADRALNPEQIIVGAAGQIPESYWAYLKAFDCPVWVMTLEDAEFAKLAINYCLAKQVDTTNELAERAKLVGADWEQIKIVLAHDARLGTYTNPGNWRNSRHLLRDYVTLNEIKPL